MSEDLFEQLDRIISLPSSTDTAVIRQSKFREKALDSKILQDDVSFDMIISGLTSPSQVDDDSNSMIKRSYRVMEYISEDIISSQEMLKSHSSLAKEKDNEAIYDGRLMKPSRAGLLAKEIFSAYRHLLKLYSDQSLTVDVVPKAHIPHLNKTLATILAAFPTHVVGASCVGGQGGVEQSLQPMLQLHKYVESSHSPIATLAEIISMGCTGRKKGTLSIQQQQQLAMMGQSVNLDEVLISNGHRRKFVHGLTQWGGFKHFMQLIVEDISYSDDIGESLLATVEFISFPQQQQQQQNNQAQDAARMEESVGEESLLAMLASRETYHKMFECCVNFQTVAEKRTDVDAMTSVLLRLFELATGKTRKKMNPSSVDISEDNGSVECKVAEEVQVHQAGIDDNKLMKSGVADKMHQALNAEICHLVRAIDIYMRGHNKSLEASESTVKHPGHQVEKPFTSNRHQLLTLFADIVSYESHRESSNEGDRSSAVVSLDMIMHLPLPPASEEEIEEDAIYNPWPGIIDLLFNYPENNLFQFQFYRMLHSLCVTNHESTLKLVVQKYKFLSKAIKICKVKTSPASTRGVLLRCLNALRLHSQTLSPNSFLRHYLDSHDGWKDFQTELKAMTIEQQKPGGGIAVPNGVLQGAATATPQATIDVDLGSAFAAELGFPPKCQIYDETKDVNNGKKEKNESNLPAATTKKKKKKRKGKKKH
mmetsp:Transcript_16860/g.24749  ORF Transcript_16860/g.24749 Transcript_16860/m.24749 type:complete len:707 (+) Transcript_16860:188-2308(+)|eukprot:CAMPEP_0194124222 /NCGR_PEP_ID=MMETSP0150-20130528/57797_1 /TAXON_ID=122233 /ORGANISM="Chaetoceros debilis, Strain MM31A-1" /LENGTH=706 /DNA_ID=CAMNT_0038817849 /DNA_START=237 /DNA_END=2357 /DNA_ORIENTATION=+